MTFRIHRLSPVLLSLVVSLLWLQPLQAVDQVLRKSSKTAIRGKITAVTRTGCRSSFSMSSRRRFMRGGGR